MTQKRITHDDNLRNIITIFLGILLFGLAIGVFSGDYGLNGRMNYGMSSGWLSDGFLVSFLYLALQLAVLVIVIFCGAAIVGILRNDTKANQAVTHTHHKIHHCANCGLEVENGWKHCPACGFHLVKEHKKNHSA
ncbi:MAG TPA: zinc ribbon domain-containing protein, partial [Bacillota bacterium]|nr:zinc ribbon domain-containing protein [Bacillota bacterium]